MKIPNLINLQGFTVLRVNETDHDYHVKVEATVAANTCPHCGAPNAVGFGRREQIVRDLPTHGKRTSLYIDTRRFRCRSCMKTFYEALPHVDPRRNMTTRLVEWICSQAAQRTFVSIAEEVGVTEGTIRLIYKEHAEQQRREYTFPTPRWLGIDEIHLIKPRCVMTDVENRTLLDILPNRNKDTVIRRLSQLDNRKSIEYVAMDMWAPYRDAAKIVLPDALAVVDKFHVVKMANEAVERVRKALRAGMTSKQKLGLKRDRHLILRRHDQLSDQELMLLDGWVNSYPMLFKAYRLKEEFFQVYDAADAEEAVERFDRWRQAIPADQETYWTDLIRAWSNWSPQILAYFDHRITNAYTESLNNLIRATDRLGRGYSFEVLRSKMLEMQSGKSTDRPKFERLDMDGEKPFNWAMVKNLVAPDISTIIKGLEAATF